METLKIFYSFRPWGVGMFPVQKFGLVWAPLDPPGSNAPGVHFRPVRLDHRASSALRSQRHVEALCVLAVSPLEVEVPSTST